MDHQSLFGIGVSAGFAVAPAVKVMPAPSFDSREPASTDPAADGQRIREAMAAVAESMRQRATTASESARPILEATAQLASDRALAKAADKKLKAGAGVTRAVHDAVEEYATLLANLGGYGRTRDGSLRYSRPCDLRPARPADAGGAADQRASGTHCQ